MAVITKTLVHVSMAWAEWDPGNETDTHYKMVFEDQEDGTTYEIPCTPEALEQFCKAGLASIGKSGTLIIPELPDLPTPDENIES